LGVARGGNPKLNLSLDDPKNTENYHSQIANGRLETFRASLLPAQHAMQAAKQSTLVDRVDGQFCHTLRRYSAVDLVFLGDRRQSSACAFPHPPYEKLLLPYKRRGGTWGRHKFYMHGFYATKCARCQGVVISRGAIRFS